MREKGVKIKEIREGSINYPMGGVWPSPFSSKYLSIFSLDTLPVAVLFSNKRVASEALAFNTTKMHKTNTTVVIAI